MRADMIQGSRHPSEGGSAWSREYFELKLRERQDCRRHGTKQESHPTGPDQIKGQHQFLQDEA